MARWADYLISGMILNGGDKIAKFIVQVDEGNSAGPPGTMSKQIVLNKIQGGKSFRTICPGRNYKWQKGKTINQVNVGDECFLRIDQRKIPRDKLELKHFSAVEEVMCI